MDKLYYIDGSCVQITGYNIVKNSLLPLVYFTTVGGKRWRYEELAEYEPPIGPNKKPYRPHYYKFSYWVNEDINDWVACDDVERIELEVY